MNQNCDDEIKRLRESENKYRKMMEQANDAIFVIDTSSAEILEVNPTAELMTGYSIGELVGMKVWELHPPDENELAKELFHKVVSTGVGTISEIHFQKKDGTTLVIDVSASMIEFGSKRVIQRICRDVTHRKKLEEELQKANEDLEGKIEKRTRELSQKHAQLLQFEKMASLGHLVAGVAHEINTPLGAMVSNNDVLIRSMKKFESLLSNPDLSGETGEHPEILKLLQNINNLNDITKTAANRIVKIVTSLRKFARLEEAELDKVDIHEGLLSTLTLVHHELKNRIEVHKNFSEVPEITCYPSQLNQVFMNLLVNASQAIETKGDIYISTYVGDNTVIVEFRDTGKGIPKENLERIFDPGFTTKGAGVGTGLGLSIVYQIIQDHGGDIEVESQVGMGTTFRVVLPIR